MSNNSVQPYMRSREVEFSAQNLRPGRSAQAFFGPTNVTRFCQAASVIVPDTANANVVNGTVVGERLYCNNTNYMVSVIGASMSNTLYINENYISINISQIGANSSAAADYSVGDIIWQGAAPAPLANITADVFEGQVAYFNSSKGVLVVEALSGNLTCNATSTTNTSAWLWKSGSTKVVSANTIVTGNNLPINAVVQSLDNVSNKFLVGSYQHNGGIVGFPTAVPNSNCVILMGPAPANLVGNVMYVSGQTGAGQGGQVLSVSGNIAVLNVALDPVPTGNSYYSIAPLVVDAVGNLCGIFNLPETQTVEFLTPSQTFTLSDSAVVDDPDSTMLAQANYVSTGTLGSGTGASLVPVVQPSTPAATAVAGAASGQNNPQTVLGSAGPNTTYAGVLSQLAANAAANMTYNGVSLAQIGGTFSVSPISQTFLTPAPTTQNTNFGIFVSSVDIWFNVGPTGDSPQFPVQLSIVQTANGLPTQNVIATTSVPFNDIQYSDVPDSINIGSSINNNATVTRFVFDDPVYLQPATAYAITLYSESPDYEVFVAQVGDTDISTGGSAQSKRVTTQNSVVAFFTSQNASVWDSIPNKMLMFVVNKAVFSLEPVSITFNMDPINQFIVYDEMILGSSDLTFSPCNLTYKVQTNLANSLSPESAFTQVNPNQTWDFGQDLSISSLNGTRRRIIFGGNNQQLVTQVSMQTQNPDVSPVFNAEMLSAALTTNVINDGGIDQRLITITNSGNHINAANIIVTISAPDLTDGVQATANVPSLNSNSITGISIINPGAGYSLAPTITLSEPGAPVNATATIAGENAISGGNSLSRYITRPVTLASGMAAGDLRVYISAIAPAGTDIAVYYKVLGTADNRSLSNIPWVEMEQIAGNNISPDQNTPVALQYCPALGPNGLPSGVLQYTQNGVVYPLGSSFQTFAIKIVLFADDPTVPPVMQSLQVIAYPAG